MTEITAKLSTALADRYKIERRIGEGGMATVYLAHDLKHERQVALKVLKPELAAVIGGERFVQEIKVTANLQHPNILPLYDSGESDSFLYYVMPFVDGESLRDRLDREKQFPVDEAVKIAEAVATALDYAHRHDIVHRDIKPENVLMHDGQALVADFGIALAVSAAAGNRLTETGLSIGTPHYMSPEQASADRELDGRSDVYSLGATLYEMLVGNPPFTAASAQAIVAKILTETPRPVASERASVPPNVDAAISRSLAKLPADRFATAAAFAQALGDSAYTEEHPASATHDLRPTGKFPFAGWAVASVLALVLGWGVLRPTPNVERPVTRFTIPVPEGHVMGRGWWPALAVSPDGRSLAYVSGRTLFLRRFDEQAASIIYEGEANGPFFSADGRRLAFTGSFITLSVSVDGGPVAPLPGMVSGGQLRPSWAGDVVFYTSARKIVEHRLDGSGSREVTPLADTETEQAWPQHLPGDLLLFSVVGQSMGFDEARLVLVDLKTGERVWTLPGAAFGYYVRPGFMLYAQDNGTIMALPFDLERREATGSPTPVLDSVRVGTNQGSASYTISDGGTLAYVKDPGVGSAMLVRMDREGNVLDRIIDAAPHSQPTLSPNGRTVAMTRRYPNNDDIWMVDADDGTPERVTFHVREEETPIWGPQGERLAYTAYGGSQRHVYLKELETDDPAVLVYEDDFHVHATSWSPDGDWIALDHGSPQTGADIWLLNLDDTDNPVRFAITEANEQGAVFSPDGRWLAYESDANGGRRDVFVVPWPNRTPTFQVSLDGGLEPQWSPDGSTLYFWKTDGNRKRLHAVTVPREGRFSVQAVEELFDVPATLFTPLLPLPGNREFLVLVENEEGKAREIHVVLNFVEELKAKVGN